MLRGFKIPFSSVLMLRQGFYKISLLNMFFYVPLVYLFFSLALLSDCGSKANFQNHLLFAKITKSYASAFQACFIALKCDISPSGGNPAFGFCLNFRML